MLDARTITFVDNPAIKGKEDKFISLNIAIDLILVAWRESLFAHEWLTPNGALKDEKDLSDTNLQKKRHVEELLKKDQALPKPILGIGIMDNIEIGSGKDILLTLAHLQQKTIEVHIPKSHSDDFKLFLR